MSVEEDYSTIKEMLSKLYSNLKLNFKKTFISLEENEDSDENEENTINNLSIIDLINCISAYVNNLLERNNSNNQEIFKEEENGEKPLYKQYEELLIKAEDDIRKHIKVEQQLKIKIEDLEFELNDYRTGKIKKKVKNLICVSEPGYYSSFNYQKQKSKFKGYNNYSDINNSVEKPISVNSNNNYIISKLKKENENLKLKLSKLENESNNTTYNSNNDKYKQIDNKIHQRKINDGIKITKNIINNKNYISKNNYYSFGNNTFTNNFYNLKENKSKINNNSSNNDLNINLKNFTKMLFNNKTSANSFIAHPKKNNNNKNELIKSFPIFKTDSNKKNSKKLIYEKNKIQFKKIHNNLFENNNFIEIKIKDENSNSNYNNINNNKRIYTLNNNNDTKNIFSKKKNLEKKKGSKLNLNLTNNNLYQTDRKKNNPNIKKNSNSNIAVDDKERNTLYIPKCEFNLTWSKFPLKNEQTSSNLSKGQTSNNNYQKNSIQSLIRNSTNVKNSVNKSLNKKLLSQFKKKNKNIITTNPNKFPNNSSKTRKDTTPQKITINRRKTINIPKTNNSSMKNINYINYTKPKMKDEFYLNIKDNIDNLMNTHENSNNSNNMMIKTQNNFYLGKGDIYIRKKRNLAFGIEIKNNKKLGNKNEDNYDKIEI